MRRRLNVAQEAFKFQKAVGKEGKVEISLPLPLGTQVEVLVLAPLEDSCHDLRHLFSLDFWDNPQDDEAWNNA